MLEADAIDRIVEFDVDTEVVAVQLELVSGTQPGVLVKVGSKGRNRPFEGQLSVLVLAGVGLVIDAEVVAHERLLVGLMTNR